MLGVLNGSFLNSNVGGGIAFLISLKGEIKKKVWETLMNRKHNKKRIPKALMQKNYKKTKK